MLNQGQSLVGRLYKVTSTLVFSKKEILSRNLSTLVCHLTNHKSLQLTIILVWLQTVQSLPNRKSTFAYLLQNRRAKFQVL